jgi:hypothetical protein
MAKLSACVHVYVLCTTLLHERALLALSAAVSILCCANRSFRPLSISLIRRQSAYFCHGCFSLCTLPNISQVLLLFDNLRMVRVERADATLPLLPWPPAGLQNSSRTQQPSKGAAFLLLLGAMRAHMLSVTWRALLLVSSANPVSAGFVRRLMRCIEVPRMQVCARAHG